MITQFISDSSWNCIANLFPHKHRGRPPEHERRHIFEAILYVLKSGCQWRLLPDCYPPWQTVYGYFRAWSLNGIIDKMLARLRRKCRKAEGKDHRSRIAIIDSQSVKTTRCAATKGFDGKKMVKGRKRHLLVDSLGFLISVVVTRANLHDIKGGRMLVHQIQEEAVLDRVRIVFADSAYKSLENEGIPVEITTNLSNGFSPLPQRWKVERSIGWLASYRRNTIDYEGKCCYAESWVKLAFIAIGINRMKNS